MNRIVVIKSQCFHLPVEIKRLDQNIPSIFRLLLCVNKLQNIFRICRDKRTKNRFNFRETKAFSLVSLIKK